MATWFVACGNVPQTEWSEKMAKCRIYRRTENEKETDLRTSCRMHGNFTGYHEFAAETELATDAASEAVTEAIL